MIAKTASVYLLLFLDTCIWRLRYPILKLKKYIKDRRPDNRTVRSFEKIIYAHLCVNEIIIRAVRHVFNNLFTLTVFQ